MQPTAAFFVLVALISIASAHPRLQVALKKKTGNVICPNQKVQCPSGHTCCPVPGANGYGCCNKTNAVCCGDGIHCCDQGTTCDISGQVCTPHISTTVSPQSAMSKLGSIPFNVKKPTVICPNGGTCPDDNTCCQKGTDSYGCCSYSNAVCCSDEVHCCPSGHTCNPPYCVPAIKRMFKIVPFAAAKSSNNDKSLKNVVCADSQSECPDTNTCCRLSDSSYGCCPLANAVCCSDHTHCCPADHYCDNGKCSPKSRTTFFMRSLTYGFRK